MLHTLKLHYCNKEGTENSYIYLLGDIVSEPSETGESAVCGKQIDAGESASCAGTRGERTEEGGLAAAPRRTDGGGLATPSRRVSFGGGGGGGVSSGPSGDTRSSSGDSTCDESIGDESALGEVIVGCDEVTLEEAACDVEVTLEESS